MTYAGQLRVADSEIETHLQLCGSELERWAWLITKQLESATAVLIVARDSRTAEQFVAHVCYMHACRHRLQMMSSGREHLAMWPRSHAIFGQYHMGGTSAIDVAMKFAAGLWAEIETARLWSYPRCSVEDRELGNLTEWRSELWKWLTTNRPELTEWPLWSVHQERDRLRAAIADEFRKAMAKAGEASQPEAPATADDGGNQAEAPDGLTDEALLSFTQRVMMAFFRHWETVPGDEDLAKFDGKFTSFRARPQFEQEFEQVLRCLFRTVAVGRTLGVDATALRRFVEAFRHYDIEAAERGKYDASADIQRIQESLHSGAAATRKDVGFANSMSPGAVEWLSQWAGHVLAEMDGNQADPPDPRAFKRSPDYWLPDAGGIEGCPEQRQVLIELAFDHPTVAQQSERAIASALSCHAKYRTKVAEVGDAAAQREGARLWHAMKDLASVLHSAADALKRRDAAATSPDATGGLPPDADGREKLGPFPDDGLFPMQKAFIWGGVRYEELTGLMMDALALLYKASLEGRRVSHDEMVNRVSKNLSGDFYKVFRKRKGKDRFIHPVRSIVEGDGSYRLVERDGRKSPE